MEDNEKYTDRVITLGKTSLATIGHMTAYWFVHGNLDNINGARMDNFSSIVETKDTFRYFPDIDIEDNPREYLMEVWKTTCYYMGGTVAIKIRTETYEDAFTTTKEAIEACDQYLEDCAIPNPEAMKDSSKGYLENAFEEVWDEILELADLLLSKKHVTNEDFLKVISPSNSNE